MSLPILYLTFISIIIKFTNSEDNAMIWILVVQAMLIFAIRTLIIVQFVAKHVAIAKVHLNFKLRIIFLYE